ncbi:MAG: hypothetical protein KAQ85_07740 [Thermodesulfovibrionia bacterium]|nr:hypothetical protein [Thermodesulfovibrionia bacterium]
MDEKKQKSIDEINKRIAKLEEPIKVTREGDFMAILLKGKTPQYHKRFAAWCRNTLDSTYHQDMEEAMLSMYASNLLQGSSQFTDDFVRGQANNLLFIREEMERLSNVDAFKK